MPEASCARCKRTRFLEKHHIIYKSKGGSNDQSNLLSLCKDCHDYIHAKQLIVDDIQHNWNSIKWWAEHFKPTISDQVLRRVEYKISRIKLLTTRLNALIELNTVENIISFGYRTYWIVSKTHGTIKKSKYKGKKK